MRHFSPTKFSFVITFSVTFSIIPNASFSADGDIYQHIKSDGPILLSNVPEGDGFELLVAAPIAEVALDSLPSYIPATSLGSLANRVARYRNVVASVAKDSAVDPRLLHALIAVESGYNPQALSPKGAVGMTQLMPGTARRYGVANSRDAEQNIRGGARYLSDLLRMFKNDKRLALAAYNAGEGAVMKYGGKIPPYQETQSYVVKVLALYEKLGTLAI